MQINIKLWRAINTLESRAAIPRGLTRLGNELTGISWFSKKTNPNVPQMGRNDPMHCYRQGESWLGSGFAEKDAKALVDN